MFLPILLAMSCGGQETTEIQTGPTSPQGSALQDGDAGKSGVAQLAGQWKLKLWSNSHGLVIGKLHLDATGHGQYMVTAKDLQKRGELQVTAWDGERLEGKALGFRRHLRAILEGNILYVELPVLGQVTLIRNSPQQGPIHFNGS